jgi:hypothetical protein
MVKQVEICRNGLSFYFRNSDGVSDNLFHKKVTIVSKVINEKYLTDNDVLDKYAQMMLNKQELGCTYSPEIEKKLQKLSKI